MISAVAVPDFPDLLPLMRDYCTFYGTSPSQADLHALASALVDDPGQGIQLISRGPAGQPWGFATLLWSWDMTAGGRVGVMQDLFVTESARGRGVADALIAQCRERASEAGARHLVWQTALDNRRAQAVYERCGAVGSEWLEYVMPV